MDAPEQLDLYSFCVEVRFYLDQLNADTRSRAGAAELREAVDRLMILIGDPYIEYGLPMQLGPVGDALVYRCAGTAFDDCAGLIFYCPGRADETGGVIKILEMRIKG